MKAALYARVSTEEQADNYSIPAQIERLEAYCKSQGWEIYDIYKDGGYSGKNLNRPEMKRLLKDAREKKFDVVVVFRLDRFSRKAVDVLRVVEEVFEPNKISLKSATEPFDTSTIAGRMMLTMLVAFAQFERESISQRVKVAMMHKAENGEWCGGYTAPYGYKNVDKKLVVDEYEANIVRRIYNMYDQGMGLRKIALILNHEGVKTQKGNNWYHVHIREILTNPVYAGYMVWNRTERKGTRSIKHKPDEWIMTEGQHEPIIDKTLFHRVQAKFANHEFKPRQIEKYPFAGLIFCGKCGHRYRGWYKKNRKGENVYYYRCSGYSDGAYCKSVNIRTEMLENIVLSELEKMEFDEDRCLKAIQLANTNNIQEIKFLEEQIATTHSELGKIENRKKVVFEAYEKSAIGIDDLRHRIDQINKEKDALEEHLIKFTTQLQTMQTKVDSWQQKLEKLKDIRTKWSNATPLERYNLMHSIINRIVIHDRENIDVYIFDD